MKISVVIPVFNTHPLFLFESVLSIKRQSYIPVEVILINDGSTRKETINAINILKKDWPELIVVNQGNKKISGALNTGIRLMKGDWWAGCSSDDRWLSTKLSEFVRFSKSKPEAKILYCDWQFIDQNGNLIRTFTEPEFGDRFEAGRYIIHDHFATWSGMMIHRSVFDDIGLFDESYPTREDYEFNIRILTKYMMYRVPRVLFQYRMHPEQLTRRNDKSVQDFYTEKARMIAIKHFSNQN